VNAEMLLVNAEDKPRTGSSALASDGRYSSEEKSEDCQTPFFEKSLSRVVINVAVIQKGELHGSKLHFQD
jgi:hypothetical protein